MVRCSTPLPRCPGPRLPPSRAEPSGAVSSWLWRAISGLWLPERGLGQPEILLGIIPGGGGTQRLARLIGPARAKDIVLTGRYLSAEEAFGIGLADRLTEAGSVVIDALEFASRLAAGAIVAQGLAKRAIDEGLGLSLVDGLALERELFARTFATRDAEIGVRSFLERGPGKAEFVGA